MGALATAPLAIATDGLAATPTVVKAYLRPDAEHPLVFILAALSAVITLLTTRTWSLAVVGFPAYILCVCLLIAGLIIVRTPPVGHAGARHTP